MEMLLSILVDRPGRSGCNSSIQLRRTVYFSPPHQDKRNSLVIPIKVRYRSHVGPKYSYIQAINKRMSCSLKKGLVSLYTIGISNLVKQMARQKKAQPEAVRNGSPTLILPKAKKQTE